MRPKIYERVWWNKRELKKKSEKDKTVVIGIIKVQLNIF